MTHYAADDLATADRHIAEGTRHLGRQRHIVQRLGELGADTASAERLLQLMTEAQVEHVRHREAIEVALRGTATGEFPSAER